MSALQILPIKDLHLLVGLLSILIVLDELLQYFPHKLIMFLHEPFLLLKFLAVAIEVLLYLLLADVFEDAFHLFVGGRSGELGEGDDAELSGRGWF